MSAATGPSMSPILISGLSLVRAINAVSFAISGAPDWKRSSLLPASLERDAWVNRVRLVEHSPDGLNKIREPARFVLPAFA